MKRSAERFDADGWIVGRKTMSELAKGAERAVTSTPISSREPHIGDRKERKLAIAIDPSGRVHYGQDNIGGDHVVAVLGEQVSDFYLAELREDGVSYIFAGPRRGRPSRRHGAARERFRREEACSSKAAASSTAPFSATA